MKKRKNWFRTVPVPLIRINLGLHKMRSQTPLSVFTVTIPVMAGPSSLLAGYLRTL